MNITFASEGPGSQMTIHGEIDGFEHSATIDALVAESLTRDEAIALGESLIQEAYQRYLEE
ncbi:hypothetical protein D3C87_1308770 [compost metagenome]